MSDEQAIHTRILAAIDTIIDHLKADWIADECRNKRVLGCVSCQMLRLSQDLHMLRYEVEDICRQPEGITPPNSPPGHETPPSV
jgi:hypothetical protein